MPNYRTTALIVALLAAPAALAADSVPGAPPDADAASEAAPASQSASPAPASQPASPAPAAQPASPAPAAASAQTPQPPGAAASASVPPAHQVHIPPQHLACLAKSEVRAIVAAHQAISLADAIQSVRNHGKRAEVVRARLCRHGDKLAYVLTLFGHSGKVYDVSVDAVSGDVIAGR